MLCVYLSAGRIMKLHHYLISNAKTKPMQIKDTNVSCETITLPERSMSKSEQWFFLERSPEQRKQKEKVFTRIAS